MEAKIRFESRGSASKSSLLITLWPHWQSVEWMNFSFCINLNFTLQQVRPLGATEPTPGALLALFSEIPVLHSAWLSRAKEK